MSRIRGIEVKVQKEVLQTRKYGLNEILKKKNEDHSSDSKDDVEKNQISDLLQKLPKLDKVFEVHRKIGEGTFSSVYLGSLRQHATLPNAARRWFAIKHLVPTAHPARVEHELRCLRDMGGKHHVIGVDLCLRHLDTIVFVMPYIPHRKFSEYVGSMDAEEVRRYMRALLTALRHVHSFGVIHRDVKPSNFLYDRENRRYLLVDFGLAQRLEPGEPPAPPAHSQHLRKRPRQEMMVNNSKNTLILQAHLQFHCVLMMKQLQEWFHLFPQRNKKEDGAPEAKRAALDLSVSTRTRARDSPALRVAHPPPGSNAADVTLKGGGLCLCSGVGGVCGSCLTRGAARAARAGTQGYRPPEVLLKVRAQTTAVDVWAAGVVLGSALTARYPLLRAAGDAAALAELHDLLGTAELARAAAALRRRLVCSGERRALCLRRLAARLRGAPAPPRRTPASPCARCRAPPAPCLCRDEADEPAHHFVPTRSVAGFPDSAFSLAARLLHPDPSQRPSAAEALRHPFLYE